MVRPKDDEKVRAIAAATYALVERTGLSGLTLADIARDAGMATSTLYVYYASKDALISDLYQEAKAATAVRLLHGFDEAAPLRSRFRVVWENLLKNRLDHYGEVFFQEQYVSSPWFSEKDRALSAKVSGRFYAMLDEGKTQEIFRQVPTPLLAASVLGSVREITTLVRSGVLPMSRSLLADGFSMCWDSLKA